MVGFEFSCPSCSQMLRARDQSLAGQTFVCPECQAALIIEIEGNGQLIARPQAELSPLAASRPPQVDLPEAASRPRRKSPTRFFSRFSQSIVVCVIVLVCLGLLYVREQTDAPRDLMNAETERAIEVADNQPQNDRHTKDSQPSIGKPSLFNSQHELIRRFQLAQGSFPQPVDEEGLAVDDRLSWIAMLDSFHHPDQVPPLWDRSWKDPLNEHFVRRSLSSWLNPSIESQVSPNRYPASHFVGISGLGEDAAELSKLHPRAGMFGDQREIRSEDLKDGASNIWMLSGVQENLGSWAANGTATVRPWTGGRPIGGTAGFGTGQADEMEILMADGSVRTIDVGIDPSVLDRLAVLNSQAETTPPGAQPLPPLVEREPSVENQSGKRLFGAAPLTAPKPPEAALVSLLQQLQSELEGSVPQAPERDVEQQLSQKLLLFDLREAQPLQRILDQIAEMAGIEIIANRAQLGPAAERLERPLTLTLVEPTLKTVLERILYRAELGYRIEESHIEITADPIALPPLPTKTSQ